MDTGRRGHVVCLPFPAQSHIGAMLKIAKLLHYRAGYHVSFVNSEYNHRRLLEAQGGGLGGGQLPPTGSRDTTCAPTNPGVLDSSLPPDFQFLAISDGLPNASSRSTDDLAFIAKHGMTASFCDLIAHLTPKVSCILSDGFMTFPAKEASDKYEVPNIYLWTISASSLLGFMQGPALIAKGFCPLKDESYRWNGYLDTTMIDWIDGLKSMRLRDLPSFIRVTDLNDIMLNFIIETMERVNEATATIIHTVEALEEDALVALSSMQSAGPIYALGPLNIILKKISLKNENPLKHIGSSLWKEDVECLNWLNSQTTNSVLYINFGSHTLLTQEQFIEFAMGIANSKQAFLWIIRPDLVMGDGAIIPAEFIQETKERCFLTSWCPQEDVLAHPSVAGFLTHCGWNSILESLSVGVPMLCWPFFGDQPTNCKYVCDEWLAGLEISNVVDRDHVELRVRELLGEKGEELKTNAIRWKKLVNEAADSSFNKLDHLFPDNNLSGNGNHN